MLIGQTFAKPTWNSWKLLFLECSGPVGLWASLSNCNVGTDEFNMNMLIRWEYMDSVFQIFSCLSFLRQEPKPTPPDPERVKAFRKRLKNDATWTPWFWWGHGGGVVWSHELLGGRTSWGAFGSGPDCDFTKNEDLRRYTNWSSAKCCILFR